MGEREREGERERGRERERAIVTRRIEIDMERNRRLFNDSKKGVVHYDIYWNI